jgi:hypothetical protein
MIWYANGLDKTNEIGSNIPLNAPVKPEKQIRVTFFTFYSSQGKTLCDLRIP